MVSVHYEHRKRPHLATLPNASIEFDIFKFRKNF